MWKAVVSVLLWLLQRWKRILVWFGIASSAAILAYAGFTAFTSVGSWMFEHTTGMFTSVCHYMDAVGEVIEDFTSSTGIGWIDGIMVTIDLGYFVQALIGWGSFVMTFIEYTIIGVGIAAVAFGLRLAYIKWQSKMASSIAK